MTTVVIGAGLAGIFAARALTEAGEEVTILEATEYLGGRTRSRRDVLKHGEVADVGASFVDIGQDAILKFCVENDLKLTARMHMFPKGPNGRYSGASIMLGNVVANGDVVPLSSREVLASEVDAALAAHPPLGGETTLAWARRVDLSPPARDMFVMQGIFNPLTTPSLVQSRHVHPGDIGRTCWLVADGTDTIAQTAADGLDIRFSSPARLVSRVGRGYRVETDDDSFLASNVVVTCSVTATRRIGFATPLPEWKAQALLMTPMSRGGKVVGQYRGAEAIIRQGGPSTMTDSPVGMMWMKTGPSDTVTVMGVIAEQGDGLLNDEAAALSVLDGQIEILTGSTPERIAGLVENWTTQEFFGGVVNLGTGGHVRRQLLGAPVGGVHFAGEATGEWNSSMEGAVRSGQRVASEILQKRLKGRSPLATVHI